MATDLYQGWDFRWVGTATIDWTDDSGPHSVSISSGQHGHLATTAVDPKNRSGTTISTGHTGFSTTLQSLMDAATAQSVTVTFSQTALTYTISISGGASGFTLTGTTARDRMRRILGFTGNTLGTQIVSNMRPWYVIRAAVDGRTNFDWPAVRDDQVVTARAEDGRVYSLGPTRLVSSAKWEHHFEPKAAVHTRFAASDTTVGGTSWTWEDFLNHAARYSAPCVIKDSTESMVFYTSKPFVRQAARRSRRDFDPHQIVTVEADSVIGYL